jgi:hypothetical protein
MVFEQKTLLASKECRYGQKPTSLSSSFICKKTKLNIQNAQKTKANVKFSGTGTGTNQ